MEETAEATRRPPRIFPMETFEVKSITPVLEVEQEPLLELINKQTPLEAPSTTALTITNITYYETEEYDASWKIYLRFVTENLTGNYDNDAATLVKSNYNFSNICT